MSKSSRTTVTDCSRSMKGKCEAVSALERQVLLN